MLQSIAFELDQSPLGVAQLHFPRERTQAVFRFIPNAVCFYHHLSLLLDQICFSYIYIQLCVLDRDTWTQTGRQRRSRANHAGAESSLAHKQEPTSVQCARQSEWNKSDMPWLLELFRIASHRRNQVRVYVPPRSRMQNLLEERSGWFCFCPARLYIYTNTYSPFSAARVRVQIIISRAATFTTNPFCNE